jgi:heptosyltransferase-2
MLVRRAVAPLLEGNEFVDEVILYDDDRSCPFPHHRLVSELRSKHIDAAVVARPTPSVAWMIAHSRIPVRVGTGYRAYSFLFTHRVMEHRSEVQRHELEYNIRLLAPLGLNIDLADYRPSFGIHATSGSTDYVNDVLRSFGILPGDPLVILHPGSGNSARDWPVTRFADLGLALAATGTKVVITGSPADERKLNSLRFQLADKAVSLAGMLDLPRLAALLSRAQVFVSNSTGPLHLAVAMGTRAVSFYPPVRVMSAKRWGPYSPDAVALTGDGPEDCRNCSRGKHCSCVETITLDTALQAVTRQLGHAMNRKGELVS